MTQQRVEKWNFRVPQRSDALVREAAALSGVTKTGFVESSAVEHAKSVIAEHQRIPLSSEEFARFVATLDEAPVAIPELMKLLARPSQIPQT